MLSEQISEVLAPIYKLRFRLVLVSALSVLVGLVPPYLMGVLIDDLNSPYSVQTYYIIGSILGVIALYFLIDWYQSYMWRTTVTRGAGLVKDFLFENVLHKDHRFFIDHPVGDISNKILNDSYLYSESKIKMKPTLILNILHIVVVFIILKFINIPMALAAMFFSIFFFFIYTHINKYLRKTLTVEREKFSTMMNTANETLMGVDAIQLYSVEHYFASRFAKAVESYEKNLIKYGFYETLAKSITGALTGLIVITAVLVGLLFMLLGNVSIGGIVAFYIFLPRLSEPIKNLTDFNIVMQGSRAVEKRLEEMLYSEPKENAGLEKIDKIDSIELRNVGFSYPDDNENVLKNINLKLNRGQALAITGVSGSGKTTLLKLLKRQLVPTEGELLLNGKNYIEIDQSSYFSRISVSAQDVFIFDATLHDNICFGHDYPEKLVRDKAILSVLEHFSLDTHAHGLSGGERQRIGIARALACEYDILILDEPTSELDSETEDKIIENLKQVLEDTNCIMIVVTHSAAVLEKLCSLHLKL